ncbi:MAG: hypothetical protein ACI8QC_002884 [Planctomycetota bacterium]|jgi:hypothetical protein
MLLTALLPLFLTAPDDLLVSQFLPAAVARHDATTGAYVGGLSPSPLDGTLGSTIGPDGMLYLCSEGTDQVLRFDPTTGAYVDVFIGDDPATTLDESGGLDTPSGIVFGPDGMAYVGDFEGDRILRYDGQGGAFMDVFVLSGDGSLNGPDAGFCFGPGGDLFVPSYWNKRIKRFDGSTGAFIENFLGPIGSPLLNPRMVRFTDDGFAFAVSEGSDQVLRFDGTTGVFIDVLVGDDPTTTFDESGGLDNPTAMAFGPDGMLYVTSGATNQVLRYTYPSGTFVDVFADSSQSGGDLPTFLLFRTAADNYCAGAPNSLGAGAHLCAHGFTSLGANNFELGLSAAPTSQFAVMFYGSTTTNVPAGNGTLCVGGNVFRLPTQQIGPAGLANWEVDFGSLPVGGAITAGSTWHFQAAYRDAGSFNFSDALRATFTP